MQSLQRTIHEPDLCIICQQLIKTKQKQGKNIFREQDVCGMWSYWFFLICNILQYCIQSSGFINY